MRLFFFLLVVIATVSSAAVLNSDHKSHLWTPIEPSNDINQLYTKYDACILKHQGECIPPTLDLEAQCSGFLPRDKVLRDMYANVDSPMSFPKSLYEIPTEYTSRQNFSKITRFSQLLTALNESNMMIALWGDSVMRDSVLSLVCIVAIENNFQDVSVFPPDFLSQGGDFTFHRPNIIFTSSQTGKELSIPIFMYQQKSSQNFMRKDAYAVSMLTAEARKFPNSSFVFVLNAGLHFTRRRDLADRLEKMLLLAKNRLMLLGKSPINNRLLYRETSTQHYNLSSGYYSSVTVTDENTICVPTSNVQNKTTDFRHFAEKTVLQKLKLNARVVKFRDLSSHYADVHPASAFFKTAVSRSRNSSGGHDCTHFPYQYNIIYRILWHRILTAI
mmetsp:Transcript_1680/g.3126  ORF Transcript_1680/g.3126 Transcript_1680/m.3126 type:complete len:387 (+) Transcript_1680:210-1370(+)